MNVPTKEPQFSLELDSACVSSVIRLSEGTEDTPLWNGRAQGLNARGIHSVLSRVRQRPYPLEHRGK